MMKYLGILIQLIKNNKKKILLTFVIYLIFIFLLFPFGDLNSFVSTQVAKLTQNQVLLKFDNLKLSLLPVGFTFSNIQIQSAQFPDISCEDLSISPSILGLLSFKPGALINAQGFMGGDARLDIQGFNKNKSGVLKQKLALDFVKLKLLEITKFLKAPLNLEGTLQGNINGIIDPSFEESPEMNVDLQGQKISLTSASVPTPIGPLALPDTLFNELFLKSQFTNGDFNIERAQIGSPQDELFVQIRGTLHFAFRNVNGQIAVDPGNYDLTIQIKAKPSYQTKAGMFLSFLENYLKTKNAQGSEYIFKVSGTNFYAPPRMVPANSF